MIDEIRQNGKVILVSNDLITIPMIFNNIIGKNVKNEQEYYNYLKHVVYEEVSFTSGPVGHYRNGILVKKGYIPEI